MLLGEQVNQPSMDIYSASLIMWQLFCARRFSPQGELCAHLLKVVHEDWRPPLPKHLPRGLGGLLQRCWHKVPEARPTCGEIEVELQRHGEELTTATSC